jgi:protease-4
MLQTGVDNTYRRFITLVAGARHLPVQRVNEIAQGRVWAGGTARQLGLVDRFGSLGDAVAEAARRAHLDPAEVNTVYLEPEPGWFEKFLTDLARNDEEEDARAQDAFTRLAARPDALVARALGDARAMLDGPAIQARCLDCPSPVPPPRTHATTGNLLTRLVAALWRD